MGSYDENNIFIIYICFLVLESGCCNRNLLLSMDHPRRKNADGGAFRWTFWAEPFRWTAEKRSSSSCASTDSSAGLAPPAMQGCGWYKHHPIGIVSTKRDKNGDVTSSNLKR